MASWQYLAVLVLWSAISCNGQQTGKQRYDRLLAKVRKLPIQICGLSADIFYDDKIINGKSAALGAYPWMAAIGYSLLGKGPYWRCGGSLITDQYVLTAAHCLDPRSVQYRRPYEVSIVRLGDLDLDDRIDDRATPMDIKVEKFILHERYNSNLKTNDIGIIRLEKKIEITDLIRPICLPPPHFSKKSFLGLKLMVAGWGRTSFNLSGIQNITDLQEAEVKIQDTNECKNNITKVLPSSVIDDRVICASSPGTDSCQGDSGCPLMLYRRHHGREAMFILGVVSYGWKCAEEGYPGVYTRVSKHMAWILNNLDI